MGLDFSLLVLYRVTAALLLGFCIGLERELTNKYAGLRTHILVCLGSCVFTILSIYAFPASVTGSHGDPARISAQILTGIGFIGGGTVLRHGSSVFGLTTAATLWVAASIGMACGTGMIDIALITTVISVGTLVIIRSFEKNVLTSRIKYSKRIKIIVTCNDNQVEKLHDYIVENFNYIHEISKKKNIAGTGLSEIVASVDVLGKNPISTLYEDFQKLDGLDSISIQEKDE